MDDKILLLTVLRSLKCSDAVGVKSRGVSELKFLSGPAEGSCSGESDFFPLEILGAWSFG